MHNNEVWMHKDIYIMIALVKIYGHTEKLKILYDVYTSFSNVS